jgi:chromate reductase, NAD(P)H dehydrogenase (quinone)
MYRILALSGSLRAASTNTALLRAAMDATPDGMSIDLYKGLGDLPIFNPDLDQNKIPAVLDLRERVLSADGLIISSPEYAHGVPGGIKNLLDWAVGWEEFPGKPVALFHTSPYGEHAQAALAEILKTMSACLIPAANLTVNLRGKKPDEMASILAAPDVTDSLRRALATFARALSSCRSSSAA